MALPSNRVTQIVQLNNVTTKVIEEALKQLGTTRRWREMSWPEGISAAMPIFPPPNTARSPAVDTM